MVRDPRTFIRDRNAGVGHGRSRRISDRASNRSHVALREQNAGHEQSEQKEKKGASAPCVNHHTPQVETSYKTYRLVGIIVKRFYGLSIPDGSGSIGAGRA